MNEKDTLQDRYYELLRLQRRVNRVLDAEVAGGVAELGAAQDTLTREVSKLVRLDADQTVFKAIARAAWETPDGEKFAKLARETEAKTRLKALTAEYGAPAAFRQTISEAGAVLQEKEKRLGVLDQEIARFEKQLTPVEEHNKHAYGSNEIRAANRKRLEGAGFFTKIDDEPLARACSVMDAYNKENGYRNKNDVFVRANCFDDIEQLEKNKKEADGLRPEVDFLKDKSYQRLAAYKEVRELQQVLGDSGSNEDAPVDIDTFQREFIARLGDDRFLSSFARSTPSGVGGSVILAALTLRIRRQIEDGLKTYQDNVREITANLEGPIGTLARVSGAARPIDGIEQDIRTQAIMAGYLCESASAAFESLNDFQPDHTEGPVSLTRDIQMHMLVDGHVDPAYLHQTCGLDHLLTKYFNVNAARPEPDFASVLGNPVSVERIDRRYAGFLKDNAGDDEVRAAGFNAGQFDTYSIERFLLNRYFNASATKEDIIAALREEAGKVTSVQDQRESMGIPRNGPELPAGFEPD